MARLYANENFPLPVVQELRRLSHFVLTVREAGKADQAVPDRDVLEFARSQSLCLVTLNRRHFIQLHYEMSDHAGVIVCTFDRDFAALANRIHSIIELESPLTSKPLRINRPG